MTQWPSNSKYWPREKKNISTKDSHINAPGSFVHHSRMRKQFKCPSTAEWIHRYFHMCSVFKRNRLVISSEKAMATHSSILAWKIPWTEEPGRLQSLGSHRVGHDWVTSLSLFTFMHWRSESEVAQSCPTLSDPMDCGPPGSSVHEIIFQIQNLKQCI